MPKVKNDRIHSERAGNEMVCLPIYTPAKIRTPQSIFPAMRRSESKHRMGNEKYLVTPDSSQLARNRLPVKRPRTESQARSVSPVPTIQPMSHSLRFTGRMERGLRHC